MNSPRFALFWSFADKYIGVVLTLAASMILARLLTPAEIGIYSMCAALVAVAAMVRDFGVGEYIVQAAELNDDILRSAYAVAILIAWSMGMALFLSAGAIAAHYAEPRIVPIIHVMAFNFFLLPLATPGHALLTREMAFRKIFIAQLTSTIVHVSTSVGLAFLGFGPLSLAYASAAGTLAQAIVITIARPRGSFLMPRLVNAGPVFRFGVFLVSFRVLESLTSNAHEFLLANSFGFAKVGLFSRAKGLVDMFHSNVAAAIGRVATPSLAAALRSGESLTEKFSAGTALYSAVSWPFFVFLAIAAPEMIDVLFGAQWKAAGPVASGLALAMLPTSLSALNGNVLAAMGQVRRRLMVSLIWCPSHIAGLLIVMPFGFGALPIAWGVTNLIILALLARQTSLLLHASYRELYGASFGSLPATVLTAAAGAVAIHLARAAEWHSLLSLVVATSAAMAGWIGGLVLVSHPLLRECGRAWAASRTLLRGGKLAARPPGA